MTGQGLVFANSGVTAGAQLIAGGARGGFIDVVLLSAAAATATVTIYDNSAAASGTILCVLSCVANTSNWVEFDGAPFAKGLYAVVTGAGAQVVVTYA